MPADTNKVKRKKISLRVCECLGSNLKKFQVPVCFICCKKFQKTQKKLFFSLLIFFAVLYKNNYL